MFVNDKLYRYTCEAKKLIVGKTPRNQWKRRAHKDPVPTLVPEYKGETLYSGTGTVP